MQAKFTTPCRFSLRRILASLNTRLRRKNPPKVSPHAGDVPDYLRADVGLHPQVRRGRHSGDPPVSDPFRLL